MGARLLRKGLNRLQLVLLKAYEVASLGMQGSWSQFLLEATVKQPLFPPLFRPPSSALCEQSPARGLLEKLKCVVQSPSPAFLSST